MENMSAVAIFPKIEPQNLEKFKSIVLSMLVEINKQESILRYEVFFNSDSSSCVILEEYDSPKGVFEHVKRNSKFLNELTKLGGKIEGSVFPLSSGGEALAEIKANWDTKFHVFFSGKSPKR